MIVDTEVLLKKLSLTQGGLAKKEIVEDTASYIFDGGYVYTYNDSTSAVSWVPINEKIVVKAKPFYHIIKESSDKYVEIHSTDSTLYINGNETSAKISINRTSPLQFSIYELGVPPIYSDKWASVSKDLIPHIKTSFMTTSKNMAKPTLTCVYWNNNVIQATDNYSITSCTLTTSHPEAKNILIPSEAVSLLLKIDPVAFALTGDWLHFKTTEDAIISCRTFEGVFPDLGGCLSKECTTFIEFPSNFAAILKRVGKIAPKNHYLQKEATVTICNGQLTVHARMEEGGEFKGSCPINSRDTLKFTVDPERLKQFLDRNGNNVVGFAKHHEGAGLLRFESDNLVQMLIVTLSK